MEALVQQRKSLVLILVKKTQNNGGDSIYLFVNGKEMFKFKANNGNVKFPAQLCLRSKSNGFGASESREVYLKGNVCDFSINYYAIDKSDILNIHKYLMVKNNIK